MSERFRIFGLGLVSVVLIGCERRSESPVVSSSTTAATQTVLHDPPATQPVAPPQTLMYISRPDQPEFIAVFPPAKLVLRETDGRTQASLFSIDPPEALKSGYAGNTFFLEMTFDATGAELSGQEHLFLKSPQEKPDDDTGIFLSGRAIMLQPLEAAVRIEQIEHVWTVTLAGTFQEFELTNPDAVARVVQLRTSMSPEVVIRK
jgi:hypothetical protein